MPESRLLSALSVLLFLVFGCALASEDAAEAADDELAERLGVIEDFLARLPDAGPYDPQEYQPDVERWDELLSTQLGRPYAQPFASLYFQSVLPPLDVTPFLDRTLVLDTVAVREGEDRAANRSYGLASCTEAGEPAIWWAIRSRRSVAPAVFVFLREHEFAHHKLGHVSCADGRSRRRGGAEEELEADCEAARVLDRLGLDGARVIDRAYGALYAWDDRGGRSHPSSVARAEALETYESSCDALVEVLQ